MKKNKKIKLGNIQLTKEFIRNWRSEQGFSSPVIPGVTLLSLPDPVSKMPSGVFIKVNEEFADIWNNFDELGVI